MRLPDPSKSAPIERWLDGVILRYGFTRRAKRHILHHGQVAALCGRELAWRLFSNVPAGPICKQCWASR